MAVAGRQYKTTGLQALYNAEKQLGITVLDLCEAIGYSRNSANGWIRKGKMPATAALACEALVRRQTQGYKPPQDDTGKGNIVVIVKCKEVDDYTTLKKILAAMSRGHDPAYEFVRLDCRSLTLQHDDS